MGIIVTGRWWSTKKTEHSKTRKIPEFEKVPSGIKGLDIITGGGLPKGRPALVSGGPGCGKTLFAMEFIIRGIVDYNEPGVFVAFEEKIEDLEKNFLSMGFDLKDLIKRKKLVLDHIYIDRTPRSRRPANTILRVCSSASVP